MSHIWDVGINVLRTELKQVTGTAAFVKTHRTKFKAKFGRSTLKVVNED